MGLVGILQNLNFGRAMFMFRYSLFSPLSVKVNVHISQARINRTILQLNVQITSIRSLAVSRLFGFAWTGRVLGTGRLGLRPVLAETATFGAVAWESFDMLGPSLRGGLADSYLSGGKPHFPSPSFWLTEQNIICPCGLVTLREAQDRMGWVFICLFEVKQRRRLGGLQPVQPCI
jgi:hypothetical protein